jgi:hypothetical protein
MSRGLGRVQTGLLAIIERQAGALSTYKLARLYYQPDVEGQCWLTEAQAKATYRAPLVPVLRAAANGKSARVDSLVRMKI